MSFTHYPKIVDLQNCEDEPIHLIPQIQSHGFLLVIDKKDCIAQKSSNANLFFSNKEVLNKSLKEILSTKAL